VCFEGFALKNTEIFEKQRRKPTEASFFTYIFEMPVININTYILLPVQYQCVLSFCKICLKKLPRIHLSLDQSKTKLKTTREFSLEK
jgi:hypothetical protein